MNLKEVHNIKLRGKEIQILEEIVDLYQSQDIGFDKINYGNIIQLELNLKILCEDEYTTVKYFVLVNEYLNEFHGSNEDRFLYRKIIYRKTPLSEIKLLKNQSLALYLISVIESICNNPIKISKLEFEDLDVTSIFNIKDKNWETIQYGIFYLSEQEKNDFPLKNETIVKWENSNYSLKLLPIGNINVYKYDVEIIRNQEKDILSLWNVNLQKEKNLIYSGSLDECLVIFKDEKSLLLKFIEYKSQNTLNFGDVSFDDDSRRNYFDTMTDGNLGDYDDFNGNIDDIDTWSRG